MQEKIKSFLNTISKITKTPNVENKFTYKFIIIFVSVKLKKILCDGPA